MNKSKKKNKDLQQVEKDVIEFNGIVEEALPSAFFKVICERGENKKHIILATISGKLRMNNIKIIPGDSVIVETSLYDFSRGRIVWRQR
jgi:translation initiation factor IF-1